jgi:hypothetical protein
MPTVQAAAASLAREEAGTLVRNGAHSLQIERASGDGRLQRTGQMRSALVPVEALTDEDASLAAGLVGSPHQPPQEALAGKDGP